MKNVAIKILAAFLLVVGVQSCKKGEVSAQAEAQELATDSAAVSDSISMAASQQLPDRKFVKTAQLEVEVGDTYDATIFIEGELKKMGGFVTNSELNSQVLSEKTYNISSDKAVTVKKYQMGNQMEVRVPSHKLGVFLTLVNDKSVFLSSRIIHAEDVTNNTRIAALENSKITKTAEVIDKMKNDDKKASLLQENIAEDNQQKIANITLADDLKYSLVQISIKEPSARVAEIPVRNTTNYDSKYDINFLYEVKYSIYQGFYVLQKVLAFFVSLWPLILFVGLIYYLLNRKKTSNKKTNATTSKPSS